MPRTCRPGHGLALSFLHLALSGCGAPDGAMSDLQSACGRTLDLQDVELYDGHGGVSRAFVNRQRLAVGLLRWRDDIAVRYREGAGNVAGEAWCTGTLISHDLFLTAGHCLDPQNTSSRYELPREKGGVPPLPAVLAREFVVEFRYEISAQTATASVGQRFDVVRLEEYRSMDLDYAILRVSPSAGQSNGVTPIAPYDAQPGSRVAILQHPLGSPMKIGAGPVSSVQGPHVFYDSIDTLGGSSGSGIIDVETGKLVGIHTNGGCSKSGGANYGVTIGALLAASFTLEDLIDRSKDFVVGDWDGDGTADLAVLHEGCLYPDADHDGAPDHELRQCPVDKGADEYFVGRWYTGFPTRLGWRRGACVYLDGNPEQPLCYGTERDRFEILIADWDGDGLSDIGVQRGACIDFDIDIDGVVDVSGYCFGKGLAEDQYLVGDWDGSGRDSIAVRMGRTVSIDSDRDGVADETRIYGGGGNEAQYLAGDWNGDGRAKLAVRQGNACLMTHDTGEAAREDAQAEEIRVYRDFWSAR